MLRTWSEQVAAAASSDPSPPSLLMASGDWTSAVTGWAALERAQAVVVLSHPPFTLRSCSLEVKCAASSQKGSRSIDLHPERPHTTLLGGAGSTVPVAGGLAGLGSAASPGLGGFSLGSAAPCRSSPGAVVHGGARRQRIGATPGEAGREASVAKCCLGLGRSSVIHCVLSMCGALGWIPPRKKKERKKESRPSSTYGIN